ncbi:uncharacterized protein LOC118269377 [Spodoptera frugiperda]|uniref:Uncharacterized protein LOC118269377 n=1 Tax=Spodoptera frugiperda TaxID=7108 RepID=A0A9R0DZX7_SPOFR|nr:uncharacterized protein LOC118269377 [Spodoptera frugiperda]
MAYIFGAILPCFMLMNLAMAKLTVFTDIANDKIVKSVVEYNSFKFDNVIGDLSKISALNGVLRAVGSSRQKRSIMQSFQNCPSDTVLVFGTCYKFEVYEKMLNESVYL